MDVVYITKLTQIIKEDHSAFLYSLHHLHFFNKAEILKKEYQVYDYLILYDKDDAVVYELKELETYFMNNRESIKYSFNKHLIMELAHSNKDNL